MPITSNNTIIAKNTAFLYIRMLFVMIVNLYTSRVVLQVLGVVDYGIYNVVGGVVIFFSFISAPMIASSLRYITFELAKNNEGKVREVFCTSIYVHIFLSLIIVLLAETIGLWFVYNKLNIPSDRMNIVLWVYQLSILSCLINLVAQPYYSLIIAHEKMNIYSLISVTETIVKLVAIMGLSYVPFDKLLLYAIICFLLVLFINMCYALYCTIHYKESHLQKNIDRPLLQEMLSFAGWNFFGGVAFVTGTQGVNILLNLFFGPVVNAARAIAVQVQSAAISFVNNFQQAVNPQITKSFSSNDIERHVKLVFFSSKYSFFLIFLITLPILIESKAILNIWLVEVPDHSVNFVRLTLCGIWLTVLFTPLTVSSQATGNIRLFQIVTSCCSISIIPVSYILLIIGGGPEVVYIVSLVLGIVELFARLIIVGRLIGFSIKEYVKIVLLRIMMISLLPMISSYLLYIYMPDTIISMIIIILFSLLFSIFNIYLLGLSNKERVFFKEKLYYMINIIKNDRLFNNNTDLQS